jgi:hypothetical protein
MPLRPARWLSSATNEGYPRRRAAPKLAD